MYELLMQVGEKIRMLRINKGLTLRELEDSSKVSNVLISRYEMGKAVPPPKALGRLAEALEVSVEELLQKNDKIEEYFFDEEKFKRKVTKILLLGTKEKRIIEGVMDSFLKNWDHQNLANKD